MTWVDDGVSAILKRLDGLGIADDTIVILASDNGVQGKNTLYDAGLRLRAFCEKLPHTFGEFTG